MLALKYPGDAKITVCPSCTDCPGAAYSESSLRYLMLAASTWTPAPPLAKKLFEEIFRPSSVSAKPGTKTGEYGDLSPAACMKYSSSNWLNMQMTLTKPAAMMRPTVKLMMLKL